jgi:hypothetical protein
MRIALAQSVLPERFRDYAFGGAATTGALSCTSE